jgi:uncharacterized protein (DUF697 family)
MREREANRQYFFEFGGTLVLYMVVLFGSIYFANSMLPSLARTLLLVAPGIPIALCVWAIARNFRRMDEFVRLQSLESIAIAAAVTAGWTLTYGFLENAGFPKLSMFWVWPVMGAVWCTHACLRRLFRR